MLTHWSYVFLALTYGTPPWLATSCIPIEMVYLSFFPLYFQQNSQIAKFIGPTWGPPGSCQPQMGPMLAPWTLLSNLWCPLPWCRDCTLSSYPISEFWFSKTMIRHRGAIVCNAILSNHTNQNASSCYGCVCFITFQKYWSPIQADLCEPWLHL